MRHANGTLYWPEIRLRAAAFLSARGALAIGVKAAKPTSSTSDQQLTFVSRVFVQQGSTYLGEGDIHGPRA